MTVETFIWPLCLDAFKILLIALSYFIGKEIGPDVYDPDAGHPTNWQKAIIHIKAIVVCAIIALFFNKGRIGSGTIEFFILMTIPCVFGINKTNDANNKKILKWSKK
jgi:hypothetical protein